MTKESYFFILFHVKISLNVAFYYVWDVNKYFEWQKLIEVKRELIYINYSLWIYQDKWNCCLFFIKQPLYMWSCLRCLKFFTSIFMRGKDGINILPLFGRIKPQIQVWNWVWNLPDGNWLIIVFARIGLKDPIHFTRDINITVLCPSKAPPINLFMSAYILKIAHIWGYHIELLFFSSVT